MELYSFNISNFKVDGGAMFGIVPKTLWQKVYPADELNNCNLALRSLLVVDGNRRILIDNGFGNKQSDKFFSYFYLNGGEGLEGGLINNGFVPEDITDMVLTHLHYDHCGGGVKLGSRENEYELTFPNATYWVSQKQWDWAIHPNKREADSFLEENLTPMMKSGQLQLIEKNSTLTPCIDVRMYNGHTRGQLIPFIHYKGKTLVYVADFFPSLAHIPLVYISSYDVEPLVQLVEKEEFLKEALENQYVLFFEHDLYHECCDLHYTSKGIRAHESFTLQDFLARLNN
jgi:glyoxylase-like metal-dependent hydrolase (beta-lactamase superfamily II)